MREVILLSMRGAFVRHQADGDTTLCGLELAGVTMPDPPGMDRAAIEDCGHACGGGPARGANGKFVER